MIVSISQKVMDEILERAQARVLNLLRGQAECISLLSSAHLIVIEDNEIEGCAYRLGGTCFVVQFGALHFVVSTLHGCRNLNYRPESILYVPDFKEKFAFSYDAILQGKYEKDGDKNEDFVLLRIADLEINKVGLERVTLKDIKMRKDVCLPGEVKDLFTRGFLYELDTNAIDYDSQSISMQAYTTNGVEYIHKSIWEGCFFVKFKSPKPNCISGHPNGMSGSPVFGLKHDGTTGLFGMIIEHDLLSDEFLVLSVEVINSAIRNNWDEV